MPLDPQVQGLLVELAKLPALETLTVAQARERSKVWTTLMGPGEDVARVEDRELGPGVKVRIYTPQGSGPFSAFIYIHGGGWVIGDLESYDSACRRIANQASCVVVSINYRLAPEHKFPAGAEDCFGVVQQVARDPGKFNVDATRLAVGGDSAGGNLSAVVCLLARDRGGPAIRYQVLIYPVTDQRFDTGSYTAFAENHGLTRVGMQWFWNHYLVKPEDGANPYASCLRADLKGLPAALVLTAEYDVLRDEGEAYAAKLQAAGVKTELRRYEGLIHGFFNIGGVLSASQGAVDHVAARLREIFA
ncbi:MAG: alpha/beta hydrolase [Gemmataceae bacterium]